MNGWSHKKCSCSCHYLSSSTYNPDVKQYEMNYDKRETRHTNPASVTIVVKTLANTQKVGVCHNLNIKLMKQNPSSECDLVQTLFSSAYRGWVNLQQAMPLNRLSPGVEKCSLLVNHWDSASMVPVIQRFHCTYKAESFCTKFCMAVSSSEIKSFLSYLIHEYTETLGFFLCYEVQPWPVFLLFVLVVAVAVSAINFMPFRNDGTDFRQSETCFLKIASPVKTN